MYWMPNPLPLTRRSKTFACPHLFDAPVSWFVAQRVLKFYPKETDVPTIIPSHELFQIIATPPSPYISRHNEDNLLPHVCYDDFLIVKTGEMSHAYMTETNGEHRYSGTFLVFQKLKLGYRLYPRSIFYPGSLYTIRQLFKINTLEKLAHQWREAFDTLPDFSWTEHHKHTGRPVRLGCAPKMQVDWGHEKNRWWSVDQHPFWKHTRNSFLAMAALNQVAFPPPPERETYYHWTAYGPSRDNNYEHAAHKIEVPHANWGSLNLQNTQTLIGPTTKQAMGISNIRQHLPNILNKHAPDIPFFFDSIFGERCAHPKDYTVHLTSMIFPWIHDTKAVMKTRNAHDAMHHMRLLPKSWQDSVLDTLTK